MLVPALLFGAARWGAQARQDNPAPQVTSPASPTRPLLTPVVAVRVITLQGRVLSESPAGVSVEIGKPLDPAQVADSLRALYRSGNYADLRAMATPVAGGIRVDFIAR